MFFLINKRINYQFFIIFDLLYFTFFRKITLGVFLEFFSFLLRLLFIFDDVDECFSLKIKKLSGDGKCSLILILWGGRALGGKSVLSAEISLENLS